MDVHLLKDIGLTEPQALAYQALIRLNGASAPKIATEVGESRSNAYKVLDRLCELGLASKGQNGKKVHYLPASPVALEQLVQKQAAELDLRKRKLQAAMPDMVNAFLASSERPSIRYFQGKEGLRQIFSDMLATGKTLYLVRTPDDVRFYDHEFFAEVRKKRRLLGAKTIGLTPDVPSANHDPQIDFKDKFIRTWIPADAYTANVEWNISGDKVALISYGQEAVGVVIESKQIAESFRQIFALAASSQRGRPSRSSGA
jgi:sugar-specific transcriptional regulator TrmB